MSPKPYLEMHSRGKEEPSDASTHSRLSWAWIRVRLSPFQFLPYLSGIMGNERLTFFIIYFFIGIILPLKVKGYLLY